MTFADFLENITEEQASLGKRVFNLIMGRVLEKVYLGLDEPGREDMQRIFSSTDDDAKGEFLRVHSPNLKKLLGQEAKNVEEEITAEIEKQV